MMTPLVESLDILKDFPSVPTKEWEAAIHVDLKGQGKSVFTQCQTGSEVPSWALGEVPEIPAFEMYSEQVTLTQSRRATHKNR